MAERHQTDDPLADYPFAARQDVLARAESEFEASIETYGPGRNWREDPPEAHCWHAVRNIVEAIEGSAEGVDRDQLADAINYLLFVADMEMAAEEGGD